MQNPGNPPPPPARDGKPLPRTPSQLTGPGTHSGVHTGTCLHILDIP